MNIATATTVGLFIASLVAVVLNSAWSNSIESKSEPHALSELSFSYPLGCYCESGWKW